MTFEKIIENLSKILTIAFIFVLADSFYLGQKGFVYQNGEITLVKAANAAALKPVEGLMKTDFTMDEEYALGDKDAPVTIYEFSSLGCTHCADFHLNVLPLLKEKYIDSGKVRLIFADFPIDRKSMNAALVAHCMPADKYFDFLNLLFKKQRTWGMSFKTDKLLVGYAATEGLDAATVEKCLNDAKTAEEIVAVRQNAMEKLNIQGTPSFLIRAGGAEELVSGFMSADEFSAFLDKYLAQ